MLSLPSNSRATRRHHVGRDARRAPGDRDGRLDGRRPRRTAVVLNRAPGANGTALFTLGVGPRDADGGRVGRRSSCSRSPARRPGVDALAAVQSVVAGAASVAIPPDGAVLVAQGAAATQLQAEARGRDAGDDAGSILQPGVAGGRRRDRRRPAIVRDGAPVFRAGEVFTPDAARPARAAQRGRAAEGRPDRPRRRRRRPPGWSVGMTNFELAQALVAARRGHRRWRSTAAARRRWRSTARCSTGRRRRRAADLDSARRSRTPASFAPPPLAGRLAERRRRRRRRRRSPTSSSVPSTVTVTLTAPDGSAPSTQTLDEPRRALPGRVPRRAGCAGAEGAGSSRRRRPTTWASRPR